MSKIKRAIAMLLAVILLVGAATMSGQGRIGKPESAALCSVKAEAAASGVLTYTVTDGAVEITACDSSAAGALEIPEKIEGCPVTAIGNWAFDSCTGLTNISLPSSVTSIGEYAFYKCKNLTGISIPVGTTSIGTGAFSGCAGLSGIVIPAGVTSIGLSPFSDCTGLSSIIANQGNTIYHSAGNCLIETVSKTLIAGCKTSVIPADGSVTSIGASAFYGCTGLTEITIPSGVTSIGNYAMSHCSGLAGITLPDRLTSIGDGAFERCTALTSITLPGTAVNIGKHAFSGCTGLTTIQLPAGTKSISDWTFYNCTGLTSVSIPGSVTAIGNDAFRGCSGLTGITLPDGVTSIGARAFYICKELKSVKIPDGVTSIGDSTFYACSALTSVTIPNGVTSIGNYAFHNCAELKDVYYQGKKESWTQINIGNHNDPLKNATIHYLEDGSYFTATFVIAQGEPNAVVYGLQEGDPLTFADPTREGYTFLGWEPAIPAAMPAQDMTFTALWSVNSYVVTLIADGETVAEIPFTYGQTSITLPDVPKKEGYTGAWPAYSLGADNLTIEAIYTVNAYTLIFCADDIVLSETTVAYGAAVVQPEKPTKEGWTFTDLTPEVPETMPANDLTFHAVFEVNTYKITWNVDGAPYKTDRLAFGTAITAPTPEKEGYSFIGWDADLPATMPARDLTFNAVFRTNEEPPAAQPTIKIKNFTATKSVDYKATVTFTAVTENALAGASVHWFVNDKDVGTGETYTVKQATANYTVQCKLIGSNGAVLAESEIETIKVNTGFFAKLIAFFKGLFGRLPVIVQTIKETL